MKIHSVVPLSTHRARVLSCRSSLAAVHVVDAQWMEQGFPLVAAGGQDLETCDAHRPLTPSSAAANSTGHTATSNVLDNR